MNYFLQIKVFFQMFCRISFFIWNLRKHFVLDRNSLKFIILSADRKTMYRKTKLINFTKKFLLKFTNLLFNSFGLTKCLMMNIIIFFLQSFQGILSVLIQKIIKYACCFYLKRSKIKRNKTLGVLRSLSE